LREQDECLLASGSYVLSLTPKSIARRIQSRLEVRRRERTREVRIEALARPGFGLSFSMEDLGPEFETPDWSEEGVRHRI